MTDPYFPPFLTKGKSDNDGKLFIINPYLTASSIIESGKLKKKEDIF